jgi:hypothetical protein
MGILCIIMVASFAGFGRARRGSLLTTTDNIVNVNRVIADADGYLMRKLCSVGEWRDDGWMQNQVQNVVIKSEATFASVGVRFCAFIGSCQS